MKIDWSIGVVVVGKIENQNQNQNQIEIEIELVVFLCIVYITMTIAPSAGSFICTSLCFFLQDRDGGLIKCRILVPNSSHE